MYNSKQFSFSVISSLQAYCCGNFYFGLKLEILGFTGISYFTAAIEITLKIEENIAGFFQKICVPATRSSKLNTV